MAQALCDARFGARIDSVSVGVFAGEGVDAAAVAALGEIGVPLADLRARTFTDLEKAGADLCDFDLVVALSETARAGAMRAARGGALTLEFWPTDDPTAAEDPDAAIRSLRDRLAQRLAERFGDTDDAAAPNDA